MRNAAKFAQAYNQLKAINAEVANKVVSGEIKDALTRLPTMTEQAMQEAAERVMQGETRLAAPTPKQRNIALDNPREAVITDSLERLAQLSSLHAMRLKDGSILVVAEGRAHLLAVCGVEPKDVAAWQAAGTSVHGIGSDDEAVVLFATNTADEDDAGSDDENGAASDDETDTDTGPSYHDNHTPLPSDESDPDIPFTDDEIEPEPEDVEEVAVAAPQADDPMVSPLAFDDDDYRAHLEDLEGVDDPVLGYASQLETEGGYAPDDAEALARQMYGM